jgi:hypothetical protein
VDVAVVLFPRFSSRLASLALLVGLALLAAACSTTVPIGFSAPSPCRPGQAAFTLQASGGQTEVLIKAFVATRTDSCRLSLPVALEIDDGVGGQLASVASQTTLRTTADPGTPAGPAVTWIWTNWCGQQSPPFTARLLGAQGQPYAAQALDAAPACLEPLRTSELTAVAGS